MKKRMGLSVPTSPASALSEATTDELRDLIRHEQPTASRDLTALKPHPSPSRPLDPGHVIELARSIAALGLIHPIAVDLDDVVVAGSHRFAALRLLNALPTMRGAMLEQLCTSLKPSEGDQRLEKREALPARADAVDFSVIPVRILPFSLAQSPDEGWKIEVAENEQRRDYNAAEVKVLAQRLKERGYRFQSGRAKSGEQPALPVLSVLIGKSERTIRRILQTDAPESRPDGRDSCEVDLKAARRALERVLKRHDAALTVSAREAIQAALKSLKM